MYEQLFKIINVKIYYLIYFFLKNIAHCEPTLLPFTKKLDIKNASYCITQVK